MPSLMRRVPAGILATAIALSAAACGSAASIGLAVPGQPGDARDARNARDVIAASGADS